MLSWVIEEWNNADFRFLAFPALKLGFLFLKRMNRLVLALLKYPFYPLFKFDNGMNLISKSLTILTSAQLLVFSHLHIYFGGTSFLQVFDQFWSMKWQGPRSRDDTKKDEGQSPNKGSKAMMIRFKEAEEMARRSCTSTLQ